MTTGYWSGKGARSKVHYAATDGPICGSRVSGVYLVCGNGPHASILECRKCERTLKAIHLSAALARPRKRSVASSGPSKEQEI